MKNKKITLSPKEYSLLEKSIRGDITLSHRLPRNLPISKNDLIMEILEEIRSFEYDEDGETPLEYRIYENGRNLLQLITEKIYPTESSRYIKYLSDEDLVELSDIEEDIMLEIDLI